MTWIPIALEIGKSLFSIIAEAVGANSKKLEELGDRFVNLLQIGLEELRAAREESKTAAGFSDEHRAAAVARIRAARIVQTSTGNILPPTDEITRPEFNPSILTPKPEDR